MNIRLHKKVYKVESFEIKALDVSEDKENRFISVDGVVRGIVNPNYGSNNYKHVDNCFLTHKAAKDHLIKNCDDVFHKWNDIKAKVEAL